MIIIIHLYMKGVARVEQSPCTYSVGVSVLSLLEMEFFLKQHKCHSLDLEKYIYLHLFYVVIEFQMAQNGRTYKL